MRGRLRTKLPDPTDAPFIEVALAGKALVVVTFNPKDFPRTLGFMVADATRTLNALKMLRASPE